MSRINFKLSRVEHEKSFITSGPGGYDFQLINDSICAASMNTDDTLLETKFLIANC